MAPRIATKGLGTKFLPKASEKDTSNMNEVYYMPRKNVLESLSWIYISYMVGYWDKICVAFPASNRVCGVF